MINKHKSNKIKENSNTLRHLNNGTDHRHSKSCCDQSSPARRTTTKSPEQENFIFTEWHDTRNNVYNDTWLKRPVPIKFQWLGKHSPCSMLHDDVIKWKRFPLYWSLVRGIHRSPVNSPHKGQWRGALIFSLICAWIDAWVNNRGAGDLRHHRAHYDVIAMLRGNIKNDDQSAFDCDQC